MTTTLLNSCALVIDDEIGVKSSSISKMIAKLEDEGTLFVKSNKLLVDKARNNLSGISFIILDWDIKSKEQLSLPEGVQIGSALDGKKTSENNEFIKSILNKYFIPIFIFTNHVIESEVIPKLKEDNEISKALERRIFIESKSNLTGRKVKIYLENWLKKNRTAFALKMYEEELNRSKNAFLVEVGGWNSEWANLVYNTIKLDHTGNDKKPIQFLLNSEFGEFLTNSLLGRMDNIKFDNVKFTSKPKNIPKEHINKIFESIKFYRYNGEIDNGQAYEGDLYQQFDNKQPKNNYLININAPCDLRKDKLFLLAGKTKQKYRSDGNSFIQLPIFADEASLEFRFDDSYRIEKPKDLSMIEICVNGKASKTYCRIGRITPPYITKIRSDFAHFISRHGFPRHPK